MTYTEEQKKETIDFICKEIELGSSLRAVLRDYPDTPAMTTFFKWIDDDEEFEKQYVRACEVRAENIFEEILDIADSKEEDTYIDEETGKVLTNHEVIQRARLRVDARKWMLGKMQPKKYGDKNTTVLEGNDDKPIKVSFREGGADN